MNRPWIIVLVFAVLVPLAWATRMVMYFVSVINPPTDPVALVTRACRADPAQLVWIVTLNDRGKHGCDDAVLIVQSANVRRVTVIIMKTRAPSFMLFETVVQCEYFSSTGDGMTNSVQCKPFTNAL
jgi:hypothetical protein